MFFGLLFIVPIIFCICAVCLLKFLPVCINDTSGYRSKFSKYSQEIWDYSQKVSGILFIIAAVLSLLPIIYMGLKVNESFQYGIIAYLVCTSFQCLTAILDSLFTEVIIRIKFKKANLNLNVIEIEIFELNNKIGGNNIC